MLIYNCIYLLQTYSHLISHSTYSIRYAFLLPSSTFCDFDVLFISYLCGYTLTVYYSYSCFYNFCLLIFHAGLLYCLIVSPYYIFAFSETFLSHIFFPFRRLFNISFKGWFIIDERNKFFWLSFLISMWLPYKLVPTFISKLKSCCYFLYLIQCQWKVEGTQ